MPGMVDTHRHMWQTAMRGYGADWTLTQYFVWYYLEHGRRFRPEDVHAGNLLVGLGRARGRGDHDGRLVARPADASTTPRRRSTRCRRARPVRAGLRQHPGRPVGVDGRPGGAGLPRAPPAARHLGCQLAFDVTGDPAFPEKARLRGGPRARRAGDDARRGLGRDERRRHPAHARERLHERAADVYVHAATLSTDSYHRIAATGGSVSVSTESEQSAGQGYPPTWQLRQHDIPVSLSMDTSVWWSGDLFSAMRTTLGADRSREHLEAHAAGDTVTNVHLRAEQVVDWATRGGARGAGPRRDRPPGARREGRRRAASRTTRSPVTFPLLNPYGHVAFQAQRGDVHTVLVDGRVVKHEGKLVGVDLADLRRGSRRPSSTCVGAMGEEAWAAGMNPAPARTTTTRCSTTRTSTPSSAPTRRGRGGRCSASPGPARTTEARGPTTGGVMAGRGRDPTSSRRWRAASTSSPCFGRERPR